MLPLFHQWNVNLSFAPIDLYLFRLCMRSANPEQENGTETCVDECNPEGQCLTPISCFLIGNIACWTKRKWSLKRPPFRDKICCIWLQWYCLFACLFHLIGNDLGCTQRNSTAHAMFVWENGSRFFKTKMDNKNTSFGEDWPKPHLGLSETHRIVSTKSSRSFQRKKIYFASRVFTGAKVWCFLPFTS